MPVLKDRSKRQSIRKDLYKRLEQGERLSVVLKELRQILSMDQKSFAEHCKVSLSVLRKMEQETGSYSTETLERILSKFKLEWVVRKAP